jgi:uncharacterized protein (TIGR02453 family)
MTQAAPHFSEETFEFLDELTLNNRKDWFEKHKARYERVVREPALALIRAMRPRLERVAPHFLALDRKVGGSLMRVHRDVRFSKEKTPYKTNIGIHFRHEAGKDVHAPGLYVHVEPDSCFVGAGVWHPDAPALQRIRAYIDEHREAWQAVVDDPALTARFGRMGDALSRAPRGYPADHPLLAELKRKDHVVSTDLAREALLSPDLPAELEGLFEISAPYTAALCVAIGLPF